MPRCLVLVNDVLAGHAIDGRRGFAVGGNRSGLITRLYGFDDLFDPGAQQRAAASIILAALLGLTCALARLSRICQGPFLRSAGLESAALCCFELDLSILLRCLLFGGGCV